MSYLTEEFDKLCKRYPGTKQLGIERDARGVYAIGFVGPRGKISYFTAKDSMAGEIISIHERLVTKAKIEVRWITMSVMGVFYMFDPFVIIESKPVVNIFHDMPMVNFSIKLGQKLPDPQVRELIDDFGLKLREEVRS